MALFIIPTCGPLPWTMTTSIAVLDKIDDSVRSNFNSFHLLGKSIAERISAEGDNNAFFSVQALSSFLGLTGSNVHFRLAKGVSGENFTEEKE